MRRKILILFHIIFLFLPHANPALSEIAQEISFSGSPNPVGSGARALGMGGAFIGVADDATAASWNPGGLIQLEKPELSIVGSYELRSEDRSFVKNPGASGTQSIDHLDLNYFSIAYPFTLFKKNMIVSLNYQTLFDFNKKVGTSYQYNQPFPGPTGQRETNKEISGELRALSPAFSVQVTPSLSVGFTLNWFSRDLGSRWKTGYTDKLNGTFAGFPYFRDVQYKEEFAFDGVNYNLGLLWNIHSILTIGAVYKTPFRADIHYKAAYQVSGTTQNTPYTIILDEDQTIEMPQSYGIGLAFRFSDAFTMDLDVYRTDWQDFFLKQSAGRELSLFTGQDRFKSSTKPTYQVRLGGEYLFLITKHYIVAWRAGIFYDPEPTADKPDDFYGVSLGSGITIGKIVFDVAYQYRWGNNVRMVRLGTEEVGQNVQQHTIFASIIYHF